MKKSILKITANLIFLAGFIQGCKGGDLPGSTVKADTTAPTSAFEDVRITGEDPDGTSWRLFAKEGVAWETESSGKLIDVVAELEREGKLLSLKSGAAEADQGSVLRFFDSVEFTWGEYRGKVSEAVYHRGTGFISSEYRIALNGPGLELSGEEGQVDVEGKIARLHGNVDAVFGKLTK